MRTQYCLMHPAGEILAEGGLPTGVASLIPMMAAIARGDACFDACGTHRLGAYFRDAVHGLHGDLAVRR